MTRWSYRTLRYEDGMVNLGENAGAEQPVVLESALRSLGAEGFELVATLPIKTFHVKTNTILIFKRAIEG